MQPVSHGQVHSHHTLTYGTMYYGTTGLKIHQNKAQYMFLGPVYNDKVVYFCSVFLWCISKNTPQNWEKCSKEIEIISSCIFYMECNFFLLPHHDEVE